MHWGWWIVSHLGQGKIPNCNQILGHAADQNYIAIIDSWSLSLLNFLCVVSCDVLCG